MKSNSADGADEPNVDVELEHAIHGTQTIMIIEGEPGVGKSNFIKNELMGDNVLVIAPTGVSANSVGVITAHSLFCLPIDEDDINSRGKNAKQIDPALIIRRYRRDKIHMFKSATAIIVDEAWFMPGSVFKQIDTILRILCQSDEICAGKSIYLIGDGNQLSLGANAVDYINEIADEISSATLPRHPLMRCTNEWLDFLAQFNSIEDSSRDRKKVMDIISHIKRSGAKQPFDKAITLCYRNDEIDRINNAKPLANGNRIMLLKNAGADGIAKGLYNGAIMTYRGYEKGKLKVEAQDGEIHFLAGYKSFVKCDAMTIHKSQSKTFSAINVLLNARDITKPDFCRLCYVAFSRVRSNEFVHII